MDQVTAFAQGVVKDLQRRGLLPVAGLLLVVLIALPLFMLKSSEPVEAPPAEPASASADGLPSPEEALGAAGKPLVSLAVLDRPSDLDSFESKDPFKPIDQVSTDGATQGTATPIVDASVGATTATTSDKGSSGSGVATTGGGGSTAGSGGGGGGGSTPPTAVKPPTPVSPSPPAPSPTPEPKQEKQELTYLLDATVTGPFRTVGYRYLNKLAMLPKESAPLLIFLGVDASGKNAVFLVDSTVTVTGGEGTCRPSPTSCATLALEPGEIASFRTDAGGAYSVRIDQIRKVTTETAARLEQKRARAARAAATAAGDGGRLFVPPLITDLITGGAA